MTFSEILAILHITALLAYVMWMTPTIRRLSIMKIYSVIICIYLYFCFIFVPLFDICYFMTDFQQIHFEFQDELSESSFECDLIVDTKNVGISIRKVVNLGMLLRYTPVTINVICLVDPGLINSYILIQPRFAFHKTPGNIIASFSPTLNYFSRNFKKSLKL